MTDDNDVYTPAQHREYLDGYQEREPEAAHHTGRVDDELTSRYLATLESVWSPADHAESPGDLPGDARDLEDVRTIRTIGETAIARRALENGDMPRLKHHTGDTNQRADVSSLKAIGKLDDILQGPAPVVVILGDMGTGKTDLACLLLQRWATYIRQQQDAHPYIGTNVRSLQEKTEWTTKDGERRDGWIPTFPDLREWVRHEGNPLENEQTPKGFLGDEFSSVGGGSGKSGHLTRKKMGPLVFKIRKYGGFLIYVGHDESSIPPILWRVGVIIKKTSKKKAVVAERIKNGEVRDKLPFSPIVGIPQTDWRYRTKEASSWSWTRDDSEDDERTPEPGDVAYATAVYTVREAMKGGASVRETAKYVPFGKTWVSDRRQEIEDGEHANTVDMVESVIA
jgi:hypothetical protein